MASLVYTISSTIDNKAHTITKTIVSQEGNKVKSEEWVPSGGGYYTVNFGGMDRLNFFSIEIDSTDGLPITAYINGDTSSPIPVEYALIITAGDSDAGGHLKLTSVKLVNDSVTEDSKVYITASGRRDS